MTLLRIAFLVSLLMIAALIVLQPRRVKELGRKAQLIAYLWVLAILIGAVLQLTGLRGY